MKKAGIKFAGLWPRAFFALMLSASLAHPHGRLAILLSNDDGFQDPGLKVLVSKLATLGDIIVAAPAVNQSGVAHSTTFKEPIPVESWTDGDIRWHVISAMPATCVRLGLASFLDKPPDIVIAGVNRGENVGIMTFSSGTLACAGEAALHGVPGISINLECGKVMDYDGAADFVADLVRDFSQNRLPANTYLNVNYPAPRGDQIKGALVTRLDMRPPAERSPKDTSR